MNKVRIIRNRHGSAAAALAAWLRGSLWGEPLRLGPAKWHVYGAWKRFWVPVNVEFTDLHITVHRVWKKCAVKLPGQSACAGEAAAVEPALLSLALRAICLTRDYVGAGKLPAVEGWEWFDAGSQIANAIPEDEWAKQFQLRAGR